MRILKKICGGVLAFACLVGYVTWAENTQENNNMTVIMTFVSAWLLFSKTPEREKKKENSITFKDACDGVGAIFSIAYMIIKPIGKFCEAVLTVLFLGTGVFASIANKVNNEPKRRR